jgi:hypothetical protein
MNIAGYPKTTSLVGTFLQGAKIAHSGRAVCDSDCVWIWHIPQAPSAANGGRLLIYSGLGQAPLISTALRWRCPFPVALLGTLADIDRL